MQFISTTEIQKKPQHLGDGFHIITSRGKPKGVALPYFDGNMTLIEEYLEAYEISKNEKKLKAKIEASARSGISSFTI